jgi:hypothetical protein
VKSGKKKLNLPIENRSNNEKNIYKNMFVKETECRIWSRKLKAL